jgi:hypothetical protein
MIYDKCKKCGKETWLHEHHILPQATFGKNEEKILLCPTCHTEYHQLLGTENLKNPDPVFHFYFFSKWLYGLLGLVILLVVLFSYL